MTQTEAVQRYQEISDSCKARFLASLAHQLTVTARSHYESVDKSDIQLQKTKLVGINELQHHISAELGHYLDHDEKRYPDDVLINILIEKAEFYQITGELAWALGTCLKRIHD